jgi:hypothetical protein
MFWLSRIRRPRIQVWKRSLLVILPLSRDDQFSVYWKCIPFLIKFAITFTITKSLISNFTLNIWFLNLNLISNLRGTAYHKVAYTIKLNTLIISTWKIFLRDKYTYLWNFLCTLYLINNHYVKFPYYNLQNIFKNMEY